MPSYERRLVGLAAYSAPAAAQHAVVLPHPNPHVIRRCGTLRRVYRCIVTNRHVSQQIYEVHPSPRPGLSPVYRSVCICPAPCRSPRPPSSAAPSAPPRPHTFPPTFAATHPVHLDPRQPARRRLAPAAPPPLPPPPARRANEAVFISKQNTTHDSSDHRMGRTG